MSVASYICTRSLRAMLGMDTRSGLRRMHPLERCSAKRRARDPRFVASADNWFPIARVLDFALECCLRNPANALTPLSALSCELEAAPGPVRCPPELRAQAAAQWVVIQRIIDRALAENVRCAVWARKWRRVCRLMVAAEVAP